MVTVNYDPDLGIPHPGATRRRQHHHGQFAGDGVRRLFDLLLAVTAARNGFLLITTKSRSACTGRYSRRWRSLFTFAEDLDVRVFATTHR